MHTGIQTPYPAGNDASGLNLSYTILPEQLKERFNYTNYMIGKWHLGQKTKKYLPSSRGYDKFYGYYHGCSDYWKKYGDLQDNNEAGLDLHLGGSAMFGFTPGEDEPLYNTSDEYSTSLYAKVASKWIEEHSSDSPFFMYFAFQGAHSGNNKFVQAPADLISRFDESISSNTCGQWELPNGKSCDNPAMRKTVAATVVAIDDAVATVESALREKGILNNTLIIFSSDNGGPTDGTNNNMMSNFPLRGGKGSTWEGGIRVVGFANGFGLERVRGTVNSNLFHVSDWYHTIFELASRGSGDTPSLKPNERPYLDGDGISQWQSLSGQGGGGGGENGVKPPRNEIFVAAQADGSQLEASALISGHMKILKFPILLYNKPLWYPPPGLSWNYSNFTVKCGGPPPTSNETLTECMEDFCLFNISSDPCEYNNIASKYPDVVESMKSRLETLRKTTVLTWVNYAAYNNASDPRNFGPDTPIVPDSHPSGGPTEYQGIWSPWQDDAADAKLYPTKYDGPGY